jgi:hypothetical protein
MRYPRLATIAYALLGAGAMGGCSNLENDAAVTAAALLNADQFLYFTCNATGWSPAEANRLKPTADPAVVTLQYQVTQQWQVSSPDQCQFLVTNQRNGQGTSQTRYADSRPTTPLVVPGNDRLVLSTANFPVKYPATGSYSLSVNWTQKTFAIAPASTASSVVQLRASNVDDALIVTVNGLRQKTWLLGASDLGQLIDVSSWFGAGDNTVRVQNLNGGGPAGYTLEVLVDGTVVRTDTSPAANAAGAPAGIVSDRTFTVATPNRPAFRSVQLTSAVSGKIYLDDAYIGRDTPATLSLPQGNYRFGLGVSQNAPFNYTGSFYQQTLDVTSSSTSASLTASPPLPLQKTSRVAVVPIKNTYNYVSSLGRSDPSNMGVLTDSDIALFKGQMNATRDVWFVPFSYGLATWDIQFQPLVTATPLIEDWDAAHTGVGFQIDDFLRNANLESLKQQFDRIVLYMSQQRPDGSSVADGLNGHFALGRQIVVIQAAGVTPYAMNAPNPFVLHESLHNHEAYNQDVLGLYNGIDGLHGASVHGYRGEEQAGETDFVRFYRDYMRGLVVEMDGMTAISGGGQTWSGPLSPPDLYVGLFKTLRVFTGK